MTVSWVATDKNAPDKTMQGPAFIAAIDNPDAGLKAIDKMARPGN
tara:strand:+ start:5075 stop:5209 length:135 start_codon:yes stop_codon:yes gene_type:complete